MKLIRAIDIRRSSQILFLALFVMLFLMARDPLQQVIPPDLLLRLDPLAGLAISLAGRTLATAFWLGLVVLALALILGRSFCGWVCPLGTCLDAWNRMAPAGRRRGDRRWKYAALVGLMAAALISAQFVWLLDPLVLFNRSLALVIYPLTAWGLNGALGAAMFCRALEGTALGVWDFFGGWLLPVRPPHLALLSASLILFAAIFFLERFGRRWWCRVLCPLGGLLGLISRFSRFGRRVDATCTSCAVCEAECRMAAITDDFVRTRLAECILCLECAQKCATESIHFEFHAVAQQQEPLDLTRRRVLGTMGAAVLLSGAWSAVLKDRTRQNYRVRPPGSVEEDCFLDLCLRCQECVKACSSTGACLQPSGLQTGWEAWTPVAVMREGWCEYSCTLCGQVCPSGAITPLTEAQKKTRVIGMAAIDRSRCLPWVKGENCIVCEEHCPLPRKAIVFRADLIELPAEVKSGVKLPYVDEKLCIGCGICETKCPVWGESAIRITAQSEQRGTEWGDGG